MIRTGGSSVAPGRQLFKVGMFAFRSACLRNTYRLRYSARFLGSSLISERGFEPAALLFSEQRQFGRPACGRSREPLECPVWTKSLLAALSRFIFRGCKVGK